MKIKIRLPVSEANVSVMGSVTNFPDLNILLSWNGNLDWSKLPSFFTENCFEKWVQGGGREGGLSYFISVLPLSRNRRSSDKKKRENVRVYIPSLTSLLFRRKFCQLACWISKMLFYYTFQTNFLPYPSFERWRQRVEEDGKREILLVDPFPSVFARHLLSKRFFFSEIQRQRIPGRDAEVWRFHTKRRVKGYFSFSLLMSFRLK